MVGVVICPRLMEGLQNWCSSSDVLSPLGLSGPMLLSSRNSAESRVSEQAVAVVAVSFGFDMESSGLVLVVSRRPFERGGWLLSEAVT